MSKKAVKTYDTRKYLYFDFNNPNDVIVYELLKKNQYGQYLMDVLNGKYLDARR